MADVEETRPLVAGTVRWEDDGAAVVELGDREARVAGDAAVIRAVLGACDGRLSVAELVARFGADARELTTALLARGALVPAEDAWRVLHRQSSAGTALGRPASDAVVAELGRRTFAPRARGERRVALAPAAGSAGALVARRRSWRAEDGDGEGDGAAPVTFAALSAILAAVPAIPSAGALHPLVVHVLTRAPLGPVEPGLWWSDPRAGRLERVGAGPEDAAALLVPEPGAEALLGRGGPVVFLSADLERPARKYGARAYRYALMEAGAAMQNAALVATELGVPLRPVGGIDDRGVHALLDLPESAVALLALLVGP